MFWKEFYLYIYSFYNSLKKGAINNNLFFYSFFEIISKPKQK